MKKDKMNIPDPVFLIEDFKTADEIERLQNINANLLEACKEVLDIINSYSHIPGQFKACNILLKAISKAEGRDEG